MVQDHQDFHDDGEWARCLLNVESFTSYLWRSDNRYGDVRNPTYNAISYTWGNYQSESEAVKPFHLESTTWKIHLPRIQPNHFFTVDMARIIRTTACPFQGHDKVDSLWIGIACVDQSPDSATNAKEIGRQARIFRKARDVFVWFTSYESKSLILWVDKLHRWGSS